MKSLQVDVAIIGAGTAGMSAYRAALAHTSNVLVIEGGPYGTTCARVGCMPSKLLIAAADAAHSAAHAAAFGVHIEGLRIDGRAVMQRVRDERDRFVGFVTDAVDHWPQAHRLRGHARFVDGHTLQVGDPGGEPTRVLARRIVIATGSRPHVDPAWRSAVGERLIVSDDVFDWQDLPESVAVLGAGVVALEIAQALHRLGVRVCLYGRSSRLGPSTDPALQAKTLQIFSRELALVMSAGEVRLERGSDGGVRVQAGDDIQGFACVLAASGRAPDVQGLGLEHCALPLGED
ncbi:MAG: FAD-dependent oxidoreductase, partial [Burkholderiaceae bacterium]